MNQESLGEELRVLYVAMTRAKEKLILTGIKTDDIMWHDQEDVTAINLLNGRCYFDWIKKALPLEVLSGSRKHFQRFLKKTTD